MRAASHASILVERRVLLFWQLNGLDLWMNQRMLVRFVLQRVHVDKETIRRIIERMAARGALRRRSFERRTIYALPSPIEDRLLEAVARMRSLEEENAELALLVHRGRR